MTSAARQVRPWVSMHHLNPKDLLDFIEADGFADDWKHLGLDDDDLLALQVLIMAGGKDAPVVKGTGGMRKLRFAPSRWGTGKRGAARVCFARFDEFGIVLLILAYAKNELDDLSDATKKSIKKLITAAEQELHRRQKLS